MKKYVLISNFDGAEQSSKIIEGYKKAVEEYQNEVKTDYGKFSHDLYNEDRTELIRSNYLEG